MHPASAERVFGEGLESASRYVDILATKGVDWGLIGPREVPRLWERHVLNCVALAELLSDGEELVDVGSGAGLPGIPLALARPDLRITLLEPLLRRVTFLEETVAALGLGDRVEVVRGRAEEHHKTYDVATARAVANVAKLATWCAPLVPRGRIVALKGSKVDEELDAAAAVLKRLRLSPTVVEVRADPDTEVTRALILRH